MTFKVSICLSECRSSCLFVFSFMFISYKSADISDSSTQPLPPPICSLILSFVNSEKKNCHAHQNKWKEMIMRLRRMNEDLNSSGALITYFCILDYSPKSKICYMYNLQKNKNIFILVQSRQFYPSNYYFSSHTGTE